MKDSMSLFMFSEGTGFLTREKNFPDLKDGLKMGYSFD